MNELNWRLLAWPVTGGEPRIIPRGQTYIDGADGHGLRARLTAGDCTELVFNAVGAGLNVGPLTPMQLQLQRGSTWVDLFFGEVRVGGNTRDLDGHDYTLRGLSRTFDEVLLPDGFSQPQQPAHLTLRAAVQAISSSGQWGTPSLVLYDPAQIPDLGFDYAEIKDGVQQTLAYLVDLIVQTGKGFDVDVWVGVRPDRRFFAQVADVTIRDITDEVIGEPEWGSPVAEAPWTAVLWYLGKTQRDRPLTYPSVGSAAGTYRARTKRLTPGPDLTFWAVAPGTWTWVGYDGAGRYVPLGSPPPAPPTAPLTDGQASTTDPTVTQTLPVQFGGLLFETAQPARRITYTARITSSGPGGSSDVSTMVAVPDSTGFVSTRVLAEPGAGWAVGSIMLDQPAQRFLLVNTGALADATQIVLTLTEFRVEFVDGTVLDGAAQYHYAPPAPTPADLATDVFIPPLNLPGRVRLVHPEYVTPFEDTLDAVEYRITDDGVEMGWLTGQADDPAALALAEQIRKRDADAVITAVTAPT